jgi:hypothetical protein
LLRAQESKQWGKAAQEAVGGGGGHQVDLDEADDLEEFRLPMSHRPTENLDTEGLEQASVHTQLTASNVGFRLLQKMGWKTGKGLGKNEQGIFRLLLYMLPFYCHDCLLVPIAIENPPLGACIIFFFFLNYRRIDKFSCPGMLHAFCHFAQLLICYIFGLNPMASSCSCNHILAMLDILLCRLMYGLG